MDRHKEWQEKMLGNALGSIAQLEEGNLRLVKAFVESQIKTIEEEKEEA